MKESWWVDMIEGEFNNAKFQTVKMLAKYSKTDKLILDNLKQVKNIVKEELETDHPEDEAYYKNLHSSIMKNVYAFEEKQKKQAKKKKQTRQTHAARFKVAKLYFSMGL